jgi:hypothetical protein
MRPKPSLFGKYKVAFLLPKGTDKTLGKDGWIFTGAKRISADVIDFLVVLLGLTLVESYLGIDRYVGNSLQATVVRDDEGNIEHVDFQVYDDARKQLEEAFVSSNLGGGCELFFPE